MDADILDASATLPVATLGRSGPIISRLALGTMTIGAETDEAEAYRQLDLFVEQPRSIAAIAAIVVRHLGEIDSSAQPGGLVEASGRSNRQGPVAGRRR